ARAPPGARPAAGDAPPGGRGAPRHDLLSRITQPAEQTARPGIPQPYRSRAEALGARLEDAVRVAAVAAAGRQERGVLRERDGVHLLKVARRLPLGPAGCQAGAFDRVIVAAADDRAAVLREGHGGDGK